MAFKNRRQQKCVMAKLKGSKRYTCVYTKKPKAKAPKGYQYVRQPDGTWRLVRTLVGAAVTLAVVRAIARRD